MEFIRDDKTKGCYVGDISVFHNAFERQRLVIHEGQRCIVTHVLSREELLEEDFDSPVCEIVFEDGARACVDVRTLTPIGALTPPDVAILRENDGFCIVESISYTTANFDEPKAKILTGSGEEKTVLLADLSPVTTLYSKFTDPDFIKKVKEEYNG